MSNEIITSNNNYYCKKIEASIARDIVKKYHYSGKVVNNSRLHLGIYEKTNNELSGVLSYGYPMNPNGTPQKIVLNSNKTEMYELNRMAMFDTAPKLSESQALSLSIKWIKQNETNIKWLLSFSDGKEGNVGIIYQATNWKYLGYRLSSSFYQLDSLIKHANSLNGEWHNERLENETTLNYLLRKYNNVSKIEARQHIYIMPLTRKLNIILEEKSYPKKETEPTITKKTIYKENGKVLDKPKIITYI